MCGFVLERKGDEVCFQPLPGPSVWQAHCRAKETQEVAAIAALRVLLSAWLLSQRNVLPFG